MSTEVNKDNKYPDMPDYENEEEEEDDNTPMDKDVYTKMNNLKVDDDLFTGGNQSKKK